MRTSGLLLPFSVKPVEFDYQSPNARSVKRHSEVSQKEIFSSSCMAGQPELPSRAAETINPAIAV